MSIARNVPLACLLLAAFAAPIIGGQVPTDSLALDPAQAWWFGAVAGWAETPLATRGLLALPVVVALVWALVERKILQLPNSKVALPFVAMFALVGASILVSRFRAVTLAEAASWCVYGAAFYATVMVVGRRRGPVAVLAAIFLGCVFISVRGIVEYGASSDRSWRIFAGWVGPNALAAMLLVGLFVGLGLTMARPRLEGLLAGLGTVLIGFALTLTQSKGALVAAAAGALILLLSAVWSGGKPAFVRLARSGAVLAVVVALVLGAQASQRAQAGRTAADPTALTRLADAGANQEQSVGFRVNLWRGAAALALEQPIGVGQGAYRFWSAKPGLTTQTQLAHNSFLQLAAEASFLSALLLVIGLSAWVVFVLRAGRAVPTDQAMLKVSVLAAVAAVVAHSLIDSDLHYFGIGLIFFMLLGIGLLLAADAVAPEFTPRPFRTAAAVGAGILPVLILYLGLAEAARAQGRGAVALGQPVVARALADRSVALAPFDGESWFLRARLSASPAERLADLGKAAAATPSTRFLRELARAQAENDETSQAIVTLNRALRLDPNNLPALQQLQQFHQRLGDQATADNLARRLIAVEETPYYKVRSQPDLVPLETARARFVLAGTGEDAEAAKMLAGALDIYLEYAARTVPNILQSATVGLDYAGQSAEEATMNLQEGRAVAASLARIYSAMNDPAGRAKAREAEAEFSRVLELVRSAK